LHSREPAIIHRDLKLENLMYKKVEGSYTIRVADFGLSVIKPKALKKIRETAKGTPLTRAPEIMLGQPFDQKADVYSFGMVMWEIVTSQDLFPHHSEYDEFMDAIVNKGERPPIPKDCLPSLAAMMTDCWQKDPAKRPDFEELNNRLDVILIHAAIQDPEGREFWIKNFLKEHQVKWAPFVRAFYKFLGERLPVDSGKDKASPEVNSLRCLRNLVATSERAESETRDVVKICQFGEMITWFGGTPKRGGMSVLDRMRIVCSNPWFHGDISMADAQRKLRGMEPGAFLVRFSSVPGSFTITRLAADKVCKNVRINQTPEGEFYANEDTTFPTLEALIVELQDTLHLITPCLGSRFELDSAGLSGYEVVMSAGHKDADD